MQNPKLLINLILYNEMLNAKLAVPVLQLGNSIQVVQLLMDTWTDRLHIKLDAKEDQEGVKDFLCKAITKVEMTK